MAKMSDSELLKLVDAKLAISVGSGQVADPITADRLEAMRRYKGEPYGDEKTGRSKVISRDVAEAVDSMMPSLMKIFASGDEVVQFNATRPDLEEQAHQRTDWANWVLMQQNDGFRVLYDWFKDGLLQKLGTVKVWWQKGETFREETYEGLDEAEYQALCDDPDYEKISDTSYPDPEAPPPVPPQLAALLGPGAPGTHSPDTPGLPAMGAQAPAAPTPMLHDAVFRRRKDVSQVRVACVAPDDTLIERQSGADELPWGNRRRTTTGDLIAEFPELRDEILKLPFDTHDLDRERIERFGDEGLMPRDAGANEDPLRREIWVIDAYIHVDYDGDGEAELRKVTTAGAALSVASLVLENIPYDESPYACLTPIPMPHKLIGMSIADQTVDIQKVKTTLVRQGLDNVYLQNNSEVFVQGRVDIDALLNRRPGNVIRGDQGSMVTPLVSPPMLGDIMPMVAYWDQVRDQRTGAARFTAGPGADALNSAYTNTATGANIVDTASQERIALIARVYAETGVKRLFTIIDELTAKHAAATKAKMVKLRGHWVEINPADWKERFDATVAVGLGTNNKSVQAAQLMALATQIYLPIVQMQGGLNGPLVKPPNVFHMLTKLVETYGYKAVDQFFSDPGPEAPPQQPQPDPVTMAAQIQAQQKLQSDQLAAQSKAADRESNERLKMLELSVNRELGYAKIGVDNKAIDVNASIDAAKHHTDTLFRAHDADRAVQGDHRQATQLEHDNRLKARQQDHAEASSTREHALRTTPGGGAAKPMRRLVRIHRADPSNPESPMIGAELHEEPMAS